MSELVPSEPPEQRLSDAERERVAEFLRAQVGEGRLSLTELEERLGAVYAARIRGDLAGVTADLPVPAPTGAVKRSGPPRRELEVDPAFRLHLLFWAGGWAVWIPLAALWEVTIVPMLIWTGVILLHWLRAQGG